MNYKFMSNLPAMEKCINNGDDKTSHAAKKHADFFTNAILDFVQVPFENHWEIENH